MESFLAAQGLNARVIVEGAQKATASAGDTLEQARPTLDSTVSTLSAADPTLLAKYAAGALAAYFLVRTVPLHGSHLCWRVLGIQLPAAGVKSV